MSAPTPDRADNGKRCDCGHLVSEHDATGRCQQWWRYPEVLDARLCGCQAVREVSS